MPTENSSWIPLPDKRFVVLVWGPLMQYKATEPMTLEDAFYMRQDLIEKGLSSEEYSRIAEMHSFDRIRDILEGG